MTRELSFEEWMIYIRRERGYSADTIKRYAASIGISEIVPRQKIRPVKVKTNNRRKEKEKAEII